MTKLSELITIEAVKLMPDFQYTEMYDILGEYFAKSPDFKKRGFSLNKGILLKGDIGSGKTMCFRVFRELVRASNNFFLMESTRRIIRAYTTDGAEVLDKYGAQSKHPIYFDDLGLEEVNVKMYGNTANVMNEILLDRYDNFKEFGVKTYASSNLGAKEFEEIYGERTRDRLREMMNIITVKGDSFRK